MKKKILLFWVLIPALMGQEIMDGVVAIVGEEVILRTEVIQNAQQMAIRMGLNIASEPQRFQALMREMLESMINEKVLLSKAIEDTITIPDQRVDQELDGRIQMFIQQLGSAERVEAYFGKPIARLKRDYRDEIRNQLIVQTLQAEKMQDIQVSRREIELFYATHKDSLPTNPERLKLRHLLFQIKPGQAARSGASEKLQDIQKKIAEGYDFAELARQYSEDPGTASQGGDLGYINRGDLFQPFEEAAFMLEVGQVSQIVETAVGLHLIKLLDKRGEQVKVSHILIRLGVGQDDAYYTMQNAMEIRNQILAGEDFAELARKYSDDATTKEKGGDLGEVVVQQMQIPEFVSAVDTLEVGEVSNPFKTQFGYHLVKLEDKTDSRPMSLDRDYDQISNIALQRKQVLFFQQWVNDLRKDVYVDIKEDLLKIGT